VEGSQENRRHLTHWDNMTVLGFSLRDPRNSKPHEPLLRERASFALTINVDIVCESSGHRVRGFVPEPMPLWTSTVSRQHGTRMFERHSIGKQQRNKRS
jgi:hypothetical protein